MNSMGKRGRFPLALLLAALLLVGAVVGLVILNDRNVTIYDAHDHDHDGKPDHGPEVKD